MVHGVCILRFSSLLLAVHRLWDDRLNMFDRLGQYSLPWTTYTHSLSVYRIEYVIRWLFLDYKEKLLDMMLFLFAAFLPYCCYILIIRSFSFIITHLLIAFFRRALSLCSQHSRDTVVSSSMNESSQILSQFQNNTVWVYDRDHPTHNSIYFLYFVVSHF